jgi:2-desacetyl-2-hydroxyethyl bacteriochlorophyllide A dehydrogenase
MTALAIAEPGRLDRISLPMPDPSEGEVLIRPRYVGLCGTDLELWHGTASYFRDGRATHPHVFGHEWWGHVVGDNSAVVGHTMVSCGLCVRCLRGRRQLCQRMSEVGLYARQGAAAQYIRMPAHAVTRLPDTLAQPWAVLVEPAVTVVEALTRAGCDPADRVAVVGTGTIGLLAVQLAAARGGLVDAIGIDEAGLKLATQCGAATAYFTDDAPSGDYSLVVEASGAASAFRHCLQLVEDGGRVALVGVANEPVEGVIPGEIALRGITVHGIRHGLDHYEQTVALFADQVFDARGLVAEIVPVTEAERAFELLAHGRSGPPKVILDLGADW